MNGAQSLIRTLVDSGVEVCFANPGTSEMHFVAALDSVPDMRGVLGGPVLPRVPLAVAETTVKTIAEILRTGEPVALLAGGPACREAGLRAIGSLPPQERSHS